MGYYTKFELSVIRNGGEDLEEICRTEFDNLDCMVAEVVQGDLDDIKWYDHEEDMKKLSAQFPKAVFQLDGLGEGRGGVEPDLWRKYFQGGKMQVSKTEIIHSLFDPELLQK